MMKKMMTVLLVLGFISSLLLLTSSCAKKYVKGDMEVAPSTGAPSRDMGRERAPMREREPGRMAREDRGARMDMSDKLRREIQAFQAASIYFDFDRSELKPEARANLTKKAAWLRAHPEFSVRIEGHCDERGTNEYNLALGERRANAAFKFLNALGVSGNRITTVSYGEERPADPGHNESAWAKNRRDEFKLTR